MPSHSFVIRRCFCPVGNFVVAGPVMVLYRAAGPAVMTLIVCSGIVIAQILRPTFIAVATSPRSTFFHSTSSPDSLPSASTYPVACHVAVRPPLLNEALVWSELLWGYQPHLPNLVVVLNVSEGPTVTSPLELAA